jgi:hypothetical protein
VGRPHDIPLAAPLSAALPPSLHVPPAPELALPPAPPDPTGPPPPLVVAVDPVVPALPPVSEAPPAPAPPVVLAVQPVPELIPAETVGPDPVAPVDVSRGGGEVDPSEDMHAQVVSERTAVPRARMPRRRIIEWSKSSMAAIGIARGW